MSTPLCDHSSLATLTEKKLATILVVDDSSDILDLIELALARRQYKVLRACSEAEALRFWRENAGAIDLLITDVKLGDSGSGLDLAERLQALKPNLPVLAMSGFLEAEKLRGFSGKVQYLQKPFAWSDLPGRISNLLESRKCFG